MRAETSRWLWEPSEESSPPSVSQQLPVPPQPLGQTSPGGHLGDRAGQRASPCVPFPVAAAGFSYVLFSPMVSGDWRSGNLRACLQDAVGPGLGVTACQGLTLEGSSLPGPASSGRGSSQTPRAWGARWCPLVFAGTAGRMVVTAVSDRTSSRGVRAP